MDFSTFKKLEALELPPRQVDGDRMVTAIVKVRQANYHPRALDVRSQIDGWMFTAQFQARNLPELESDPLVETISLSKSLPSY